MSEPTGPDVRIFNLLANKRDEQAAKDAVKRLEQHDQFKDKDFEFTYRPVAGRFEIGVYNPQVDQPTLDLMTRVASEVHRPKSDAPVEVTATAAVEVPPAKQPQAEAPDRQEGVA